jgi:two-component system sensor histidine kinase UhpB
VTSADDTPAPVTRPNSFWRRLLRAPLFAKILIANGLIVALGATAGTYLTAKQVRQAPDATPYAMTVLFAAGGLGLSLALNAAVLGPALRPLARLERTARRVRDGDLGARVRPGIIGDPATDQLASTFNAMLDRLRERTRQVEASASRLQELSDRVLLAQEEERARLAARLLDDTGQVLATLLLHLRLLQGAAEGAAVDPAALARQAAQVTELARATLDGVRTLAQELHPRLLDDLGLVAAVRAVTQDWEAQTGIAVDLDCTLSADAVVPPAVGIAVYRLVQEALANVAAHAEATHVTVVLADDGGTLIAAVRDDGRGLPASRDDPGTFPLAAVPAVPAVPASDATPRAHANGRHAGMGLFSMQERIGLVGGRLAVESASPHGTIVRAVVPLPARAPLSPQPQRV